MDVRRRILPVIGIGTTAITIAATLAAAALAATTSQGPIVATHPYVNLSSSTPWVVWSSSKCAFVTTTKHPATYAANLRKLSTPINVVLDSADTTVSVYQTIDAGYQKYAKLANINLKVYDNQFPSESVPLNLAREAVAQKVTVDVEDQEVAGLYPAVQAIFLKGCVPMIDQFQIGTPKPAPGFQAGYVASGQTLATGTISAVKAKGWPASQTWMLMCGDPLIANKQGTDLTVDTTFEALVQKALGIPSSQVSPILNCGSTPDTVRTEATNWLTSHPQAKYVIGMDWSDIAATGIVSALQEKGYTPKTAIAAGGQANEAPLQEIASGSILQIDFNKNFPVWGLLGLSMAEDIAAGQPVPLVNDPGVAPVYGVAAATALLKSEGLPIK